MQPNNHVYLEDDIIMAEYIGDQTVESTKQTIDEIYKLALGLLAEHKPARALCDMTKIGQRQSVETRRAAVEGLSRATYPFKAAVITSNMVIRYGGNFIVLVTGKSKSVRFFVQKDKAMSFLKEPSKG